MTNNNVVDGQNVLYHYIQSLIEEDTEYSKEIVTRLLIDLSIWIPINFYKKLPIILPYVVRDNSCRIKTAPDHDQWGSANSKGFLRDDNSLLKGIIKSFPVESQQIKAYKDKKLGKGFVASHIWGRINIEKRTLISSRHYMLNSFVPNLVWLPVQLSKLTDREGSYAQRLLQAVSCQIFKKVSLPKEIMKVWDFLPCPGGCDKISVNLDKLNFFDVSEKWLERRVKDLNIEIDTIISSDSCDIQIQRKVKSSRYLPSLQTISLSEKTELYTWLRTYREFLRS